MIYKKQLKTALPLLVGSLVAVTPVAVTSPAMAGEICITAESDPDGDGFGWERNASCLVTDASFAVPAVFDPRSGEQLPVQRIRWVEADFADKSFSDCHGYLVDPDKKADECLSCGSEEIYDYQHFADGNGRLVYSFGDSKFEAEFTWGIDIYGLYSGPLPITGFAEITDSGIRQWQSGQAGQTGFYQQCDGAIPSAMIEAEPERPKDSLAVHTPIENM